jgi:hypothetical protein
MRLPCGCLITSDLKAIGRIEQRATGGRGRIRTFVARKERQIYSLLVLATHPPVPRKRKGRQLLVLQKPCQQILAAQTIAQNENTKRTRVKRHQPVYFSSKDLLRLTPPANSWWSWRRELNPRPSDYKSDALPAELRQRRSNRVRIAERACKLQGAAKQIEHVGGQVCGKTVSLCRTPSGPIFRFLYSLA